MEYTQLDKWCPKTKGKTFLAPVYSIFQRSVDWLAVLQMFSDNIVQPVAVETSEVLGPKTLSFLKSIGKISRKLMSPRLTAPLPAYLMAIVRGNTLNKIDFFAAQLVLLCISFYNFDSIPFYNKVSFNEKRAIFVEQLVLHGSHFCMLRFVVSRISNRFVLHALSLISRKLYVL